MSGIKSYGAVLTVGTHIIGGVTDINLGGVEVSLIDITAMDSTSGFKEHVGGLKDGGTLEVKGNFLKADGGQVYLRASAGITASGTLVLSDGTSIAFSVIIGGYSVENPLDGKVGFAIPLRVTGVVTYT